MPVEIDLEALRRGADELDAATEAVRGLFDQFKSAVDGLGDSFGSDMIGSLLDIAHQVCVEAAVECVETNIEDLLDYAENLRGMADTHEAADTDIASVFERLLAELGR
jgi:uncharacterized protein YukE